MARYKQVESTVVRIDHETLTHIKRNAGPDDTVDTTLRRLLNLPSRPLRRAGRKRKVKQ